VLAACCSEMPHRPLWSVGITREMPWSLPDRVNPSEHMPVARFLVHLSSVHTKRMHPARFFHAIKANALCKPRAVTKQRSKLVLECLRAAAVRHCASMPEYDALQLRFYIFFTKVTVTVKPSRWLGITSLHEGAFGWQVSAVCWQQS